MSGFRFSVHTAMFLSRKPRFGEISQIFRIGFRTRGHARNKLSSVAVSDKGSVCADDVIVGLEPRANSTLMSGSSVNYRHWGGAGMDRSPDDLGREVCDDPCNQ
jgi:hypothetical protein